MLNEKWRSVKGYKGIYKVSNFGNVRRVGKNKNLKAWRTPKGYLKVGLSRDAAVERRFVHRLVAEAFMDNPDNLPQINHIDGNKENNCVSNLRWCTYEECASLRLDVHKVEIDGDKLNKQFDLETNSVWALITGQREIYDIVRHMQYEIQILNKRVEHLESVGEYSNDNR